MELFQRRRLCCELQVLVWQELQVLLLELQELRLLLLEGESLPEEACSSLAAAAGLPSWWKLKPEGQLFAEQAGLRLQELLLLVEPLEAERHGLEGT